MRVSDSLAANWNHLWVASILLFKFMELTKVLCLQGRFPTITLLVYSATFTLIVLSAAFVLDLAAMFQSVLHSKPGARVSSDYDEAPHHHLFETVTGKQIPHLPALDALESAVPVSEKLVFCAAVNFTSFGASIFTFTTVLMNSLVVGVLDPMIWLETMQQMKGN
ncbi:hypothetical protein V6N12_011126 [Hibiscus sabdariffa]|uniref:Uncharacterized protein n=1 Tax=Hibiscus sabdariffa TaxID=183260 RepID=A0ABR2EM38_9ROSI